MHSKNAGLSLKFEQKSPFFRESPIFQPGLGWKVVFLVKKVVQYHLYSLNGRRDKYMPGAVLFPTLDIVLIEKTLDQLIDC